ncbi:hypothetical protein AAVH_21395 [Aphelenchoides avenae]|nr:hypothetical protein AAVH_21395 [Aphelenchus avenae]
MTCVYLQLVPAFAKYFTLCLMVFIGLDRLKSIVVPTWNYPKTHFFYTYIGVVCCAGYCAFLIGLTLQVALQMPPTWFGQPMYVVFKWCLLKFILDSTAVCSATEISKWYAGTWAVTSALVLNMTSACIYLLVFVMLRTYKVAKNLEKTERIYKSLCVIVAIEVVGWGSNSLTQHLSSLGLFYWYGDAYTVWCLEQALSYLLVIATTVNAPVLIMFRLVFCAVQ